MRDSEIRLCGGLVEGRGDDYRRLGMKTGNSETYGWESEGKGWPGAGVVDVKP